MWSSLDAFAEGDWHPGVHVVWLGTDTHVDVLVGASVGHAESDRALPVFFAGAVSTRQGRPGPYFSGGDLAREVGTPFISISDPTLNHDHDLKLGWYGGRAGSGVQRMVSELIQAIGTRYHSELLLVGGGGGGFASLFHAAHATVPVSLLVWDPQTDMLNYSRGPLLEYLSVALGEPVSTFTRLGEDAWEAVLSAGGIEHAVTGSQILTNPLVRRMLYSQNAADWHVAAHMAPFLAGSDFQPTGANRWASGDRIVWLNEARGGRGSPLRPFLVTALSSLMRTTVTVADTIDAMEQAGLAPVDGLGNLPRDLSEQAAEVLEQVRVFGWRTIEGVEDARAVSLSDDLSPGGLVGTPATSDDTSITMRIHDGFGHFLGTASGPVAGGDDRVGVLIYGSCVARDLFEFFEPRAFRLVDYVARQSLVSAFSPGGPPPIDPALLHSRFQRRMLELDAASGLEQVLRDRRDDTDLLLWDLTDERLGLLQNPQGHLTTDSVEIRAVSGPKSPEGWAHIPYGSREHRDLFMAALSRWRELLDGLGLLERTVLVAPPWAGMTLPADDVPLSFGVDAATGNGILAEYVRLASETVRVPVVGRGLTDVTSPLLHRWGPAPFHYDEHSYIRLAREVFNVAGHVMDAIVDPRLERAALLRRPLGRGSISRPVESPEAVATASVNASTIVVELHGVTHGAMKIDLYRDRERVASTAWIKDDAHTIAGLAHGTYRARVHVRRRNGEQVTLSTNAVSVP
ncbi:hypothetical protein ET989_11875 [Propioniciclava sinopodophylli]|uniref:Uncharacterized protein n=1 Tax=Propioniciclava sinopodophylli TaxID=1837344 RepID=A0A4Q9KC03_9ACTN|nr:DUF6270 domain-containing protein [Propioniciclava sinopodophylli]TBT83379.1 hypothetical protein ET989_11875 [Propioniciclava sinopodophylli]